MAGTITDQLLRFVKSDVPADALQMMRLSLFDWAACGIAGAREEEVGDFVQMQMALSRGGNAIIGGGTASAPTAALINGTLSHALDYDDTHFGHIGHPSVAVIPAVLALGEDIGTDLATLVEAATIGVEASILVGLWLGRNHYQIGYHQTATAGAFGATLGACRLLDLDPSTTRHALGLCASMASGLKAQFGTMAKPLNAGLAARSGVEAALWAQSGMTAAQDGLAGPLGFGATHYAMETSIRLPTDFWNIQTISHKFHACCHGLHAMLEALGEVALNAEDVENLHIRTHPRWMSVCNIAEPQTGLAAKFSYAQTAAMAVLGHDTAAIASFTDDITRDPAVKALRARVRVTEESGLSETQAEISVKLCNGSMRRFRHDLLEPIGYVTRAEKLRAKAVALTDEERATALWNAAQGSDLRGFVAQLVIS